VRNATIPLGLLLFGCGAPGRLPPEEPERTVRADPTPVIVEKIPGRQPAVPTRREPLTERLHGVEVADPYRWLENGRSPEVRAWTASQNEQLEKVLSGIGDRPRLRARLEELLEIGELSLPAVRHTGPRSVRLFYTRREGRLDQPRLLVRDAVDGPDRVLVDPNTMGPGGLVALDWWYPSADGSLLAYGTSESGSELSTLRVRDVKSGSDLPDQIPHTRFSTVCWKARNRGFYYARFPAPGSVPAGEENYHRRIFEHTLGDDPARDRLVFGADLPMTDFPGCSISPDGRWLLVRVHQGWSKSELYLADTRDKDLKFTRLTEGKQHLYDAVVRDDALWVRTNEGAPRYALWRVDPAHPERARWKPILAEHPSDVLDRVTVVGSQILVGWLHEAVSRLERFDREGKSLGAVELPTLGTSDGFSGAHDGKQAFFHFESFAEPTRVRRIDLETGAISAWEQVKSGVRPDDFVVGRGEARSRDGTRVPYLFVHRKPTDLARGPHPTLLYGYGGFNVVQQPRFSKSTYLLLERGVVYVTALLRGGGEFGEDWHRAGQLERKQNTFDDFCAVAEKLVAERVTSRERLGILGRSNGGLLVSAAVTQRPELFRVAIGGVPLADMLRYHRFLIGKLWTPEYGDPDDPREFRYLHAYSPYHRVKAGTRYPAVLLATAESDTRVDPMHARKMTAALQHATASDRPILLRLETEAGHGQGKPVRKIAEEYADLFAFLLWQLGVIEGPPREQDD
jgi:prolyl oligopeptidase